MLYEQESKKYISSVRVQNLVTLKLAKIVFLLHFEVPPPFHFVSKPRTNRLIRSDKIAM